MSSSVSFTDADYKYNLSILNKLDAPDKAKLITTGTLGDRKLVVVTKDDPWYKRLWFAILKFFKILNTDQTKFNALASSVRQHGTQSRSIKVLPADPEKEELKKKVERQERVIKSLESKITNPSKTKKASSSSKLLKLLERHKEMNIGDFLNANPDGKKPKSTKSPRNDKSPRAAEKVV